MSNAQQNTPRISLAHNVNRAGTAVVTEHPSIANRYTELADQAFAPRSSDIWLRCLDIVAATIGLVIFLPLIIVATAALLITSGRPILYRGQRVGRAGRIFIMIKFRTLKPDAETRLGPYLGTELTRRATSETTRMGRYLRLTQLDELPQLWNVLKGDMSLVGPRPIRPNFFEELCSDIPQYWQRLVIRPGITGFAQLRMSREMSWAEKLAHDLEYLADRSVQLYCRIAIATACRIIRRTASTLTRNNANQTH